MNVLISLLLVVEVITAFLLVLVILAQKSKDQGLGMAFGGGMGESLFGSRAGNVLTRLTVVLAIVFMVSTVVLGVLYAKKGKAVGMSVMDDLPPPPPQTQEAPASLPPMAAPVAEDTQPTVLQMSEDGELVPVEAPEVVLDAPEAAAEEAEAVADEAAAAVEESAAAAEEAVEAVAEEAAAAVEEAAPAEPAEE